MINNRTLLAHREAEIEQLNHVIEALKEESVRSYMQGWHDGYDSSLDKLESILSERGSKPVPRWKFWKRLGL